MHQVRLSVARPCRFVARRRYSAPLSARRFHLSRIWLASPSQEPQDTEAKAPGNFVEDPSLKIENFSDNGTPAPSPSAESAKSITKTYGSAVRRAMRNRKSSQQTSPSTVAVPAWFYEHNKVSHSSKDHPTQSLQQLQITKSGSQQEPEEVQTESQASGGDSEPSASSEPPAAPENRYAVTEESWEELRASAKAGLRLPAAKYAKEPSVKKSHLALHYPGNDGIPFLDAVVKKLAHELATDLVTLNAQDIAQLFSEQDLADVGVTSPIRSLGYDVYRQSVTPSWSELEDPEGDGEDDVTEIAGGPRGMRGDISAPRFITIESSKEAGDIPLPNWLGLKTLLGGSINGQTDPDPGVGASRSGQRTETRWIQLINELLGSAGQSAPSVSVETTVNVETKAGKALPTQDIIVNIQDYRDIQNTREGSKFITLLHKVIQDRRAAGSKILLIGTTSQEIHHSPSQDGAGLLQNVLDDQFSKTLFITPAMSSKDAEKVFSEDRKKRTMDINIRHLQSMLRFRLHEQALPVKDNILSHRAWSLEPSTIKASGIEDRYWSYNQVHWISTLALGCAESNEPLGFEHIHRGIELMDRSDRVTNDWLKEKSPKQQDSEAGQTREQLISSLRKTCNTHEKKLLNGVVDAKSIRTTFNDVHVPPETIDALKTLTSLSLIRPDAFTYGVLATDKIPGLLLYGPPGTGKTLLAKAVARESGATVLEVSGSEVYDMYVGEGEKNVKAIFTLAKKLSPCIVFIDEADAIFCSRTGASSRTSHRELINQFLREWDGMNDLSAFIMVATNRPFDLDDAVLRRLPRRLLVDLPTEEDREAVLKIHLKEEQLEPSVDLAELARRTPLYSGSDLKNLSVAAALACVREENDAAAKHTGDEPYRYPERRILTRAHFERGMEEISASISEDMSSLSAIRKFDEQYGDRKGRRQKSPGWGFIPGVSGDASADSARVRT
ncbi:Mitochondrial AAA ATPase, putative [Penicillium digitatum PHI26]|uniref:Mitochondrial AAA ATPase, putative n=3 Tax=Penicillium digitatum TaxID=36651 RepID=K9FS37_PEND2|nr:Mitochondrial AAA ATPase, putative [Penicillium digitatum Pd1]EKV12485.1 Mitochondrial AAA ATPase, putative [Penicillium digitatum PHI26]EKV16549.1 Mitochondrial AAA ATPase, putative [Penicillium digitatum Pd1]